MSIVRANRFENIDTTNGGIDIDASGHVQVDGVQMPTAGPLSNRNKIINGDMRIDQRNDGASVTINASSLDYSIDRWAGFGQASAGVFTLNRSTTAPSGFSNSLAAVCTTADGTISASDRYFIDYRIEGFDTAQFGFGTASAKTITLSFWVQSSLTGTYCVAFLNNGASRSYVSEYEINVANTWEYKTITIEGDTSGTWDSGNGIGIIVRFALAIGSTHQTTANAWASGNFNATSNQVNWMSSNSSRTFYMTGVQLEVGSTATPFEHRSYSDELARCQRYCFRVDGNTTDETAIGVGQINTTTRAQAYIHLPVTMRQDSQAITESGLNVISGGSNANASLGGSFDEGNTCIGLFIDADSGSPFTVGRGALVRLNNVATAFFQVESEL